jgi:hypothetical protein
MLVERAQEEREKKTKSPKLPIVTDRERKLPTVDWLWRKAKLGCEAPYGFGEIGAWSVAMVVVET